MPWTLKAAGIGEETVARLARQGRLLRLARGLYQLPDAELAAGHSLAEAAKLVPKGVICLLSALQFHGLTLQVPSSVWMAIGRGARKPRIAYPPLRFVRFGVAALDAGVQQHRIEGVSVRIFDPAKTVVDCFRYRNKVGLDLALEALREAHPLYDLVNIVGHGIDFIKYRVSKENQGPYGSSTRAEKNRPIEIQPTRPYVPIDRSSWVFKVSRQPRPPGRSPFR